MHTPYTDNLLRMGAIAREPRALIEAVTVLREIREGTPVPRRAAGAALDTIERTLAGDEPERASPPPHEPFPITAREHHGEPCPRCSSTDTTGEAPEVACHSCGLAPDEEG